MGIGDKIKEMISVNDEEDYIVVEEDGYDEDERISKYEQPKAENMSNRLTQDTKMVLFEPRSYSEAEEVARRLKENRACVVNLHKLQRDYRQRTIDFLTGVIFALDGTIQKVGTHVLLCTPRTIGVHGAIDVDGNEE